MSFIYHGCPESMIGTVLYPLNELQALYPDIYQREMAKYADHPTREALPSTVLGLLDCLWNDVLHCAPIHPHRLYEKWVAHRIGSIPERYFYRIPIERVAHLPVGFMRGRAVEWLQMASYEEIATVPAETEAWYRKLASEGRFGAHFAGVPHVLVKGSIDIEGLEIVRWSAPLPERPSG